MERKYFIGLDIGGSSIKGGLIEFGTTGVTRIVQDYFASYEKTAQDRTTGKDEITRDERVSITLEMVNTILHENKINLNGIGVASTGSIDLRTGVITDDQNEDYIGTNWSQILKQHFGDHLQMHIINDAKATAWGEYVFWNSNSINELNIAKDLDEQPSIFAHIIVGSGIGAGIVINREIHHGANGIAGEIGTLLCTPYTAWQYFDWPENDDWKRDEKIKRERERSIRVEAFSASVGILRLAQRLAKDRNIDPSKYKTIFDIDNLYKRNDHIANEVLLIAASAIGEAVVALVNTIGPSAITFGGGTVEKIEPYFDLIMSHVRRRAEPPAVQVLHSKLAKLGDLGGIVGAACLAYQKPQKY